MAAPRNQAESHGPSTVLLWTILGIMIAVIGIMPSTAFFVIQTYAETIRSNQDLSQRISGTEATLLERIHDLEGNIIKTRNEIVDVRIEIREINEGILARLNALGIGGRIIEGGTGAGNFTSPSLPGKEDG